jgi:hypothetical protein
LCGKISFEVREMTDTQTLEIVDLLKSLPSEKIDEVKDFAIFLREKYRNNDVDESYKVKENYSSEQENTSNIIPPTRNSLKEDLAEACGIWADREESAEEIASKIRDRNNGKI